MKLFLAILLLICSLQTAFAVQQTHPEATADTLMSMRYRQGLAATRAGLYNDALRYWLDYLELAGDFPDKTKTDDLLTAYLAVGSVHFTFEDYESAVTFFRKGNDVATKAGREDSRIRFLNNLVGAYTELGDVVRADSCNEAMNVLARKIDAKGYEHNYLFNKGYIAREKKDSIYAAVVGRNAEGEKPRFSGICIFGNVCHFRVYGAARFCLILSERF